MLFSPFSPLSIIIITIVIIIIIIPPSPSSPSYRHEKIRVNTLSQIIESLRSGSVDSTSIQFFPSTTALQAANELYAMDKSVAFLRGY